MERFASVRSMSHTDASQLAVEARDLALEEVCRLLQNPEDLAKLSSFRSEYEKGRNLNKVQLTSLVQSRVEAAQSAQELLERSQKAVSKLKACFGQIDRLCEECVSLVENHEKIQELALTHHNVTKTLVEIEDIIDLPTNAGIAEEMMDDDSLLLEAFKALSTLEGTSVLVQDAMKQHDRRNVDQENLRDYFDKVGMSAKKLEEKLMEHFKNFATLSALNPGLLVACNQIVQMQELIDVQLPEMSQKHFKRRAFEAMERSVTERFESLFQLTRNLDTTEMENGVNEILQEAMKLSQQLVDIYDLVEPCFPVEIQVFDQLRSWYHRNFVAFLDQLGTKAANIDNKSILEIVHWVENYSDTLRNLGVEDEKIDLWPKESTKGGLASFMDIYIERDKRSTSAWYLNILESDVLSEPKTDKNEKLWTPGFVDFFRILNDGFSVVEKETQGIMLFRCACSALQMMAEFIQAEIGILNREVSPPILCAFINNNVRSYDLAIEFVEHFDEVVDEAFRGKLQAEDVYRGFLEVSKTATKKLVESVFNDPGMLGLTKKLYQSEWLSGEATSSLVATLQDYLEDFRIVLDASVFKRLVESTLVKAVSSYTTALATRMPNITENVIGQMQRDEARLGAFFSGLLSTDKVQPQVQNLSNLRQLVGADSVESFVLAYLAILDTHPDTPPSIVEKACAARNDITRADAAEVNDQCRELFQQRQQKRLAEGDIESCREKPNLWNKFIGLQ